MRSYPNIRLKHFSSYVPEDRVTNQDILKAMSSNVNESVLFRSVGSVEKRKTLVSESGSDLMCRVGAQILQKSGIKPSEIDKLICSCDPMDQAAPDTAVVTQSKLGLSCPAFGISMSCVGWISAVINASGMLQIGDERIMLLSASTVGSKIKFNSPMHRAIFGDGAAGCLVTKDADGGGRVLSAGLFTIGTHYRDIYAPMPWSVVPKEIPDQFVDSFYMAPDNKIFFDALDKHVYPFFVKQLKESGKKMEDINKFIVHQASMPIFRHTIKSFGIPESKVPDYYGKYGNTISAELPMITALEIGKGNIKKNNLVCYLTYGAGFTAGVMVVQFDNLL